MKELDQRAVGHAGPRLSQCSIFQAEIRLASLKGLRRCPKVRSSPAKPTPRLNQLIIQSPFFRARDNVDRYAAARVYDAYAHHCGQGHSEQKAIKCGVPTLARRCVPTSQSAAASGTTQRRDRASHILHGSAPPANQMSGTQVQHCCRS